MIKSNGTFIQEEQKSPFDGMTQSVYYGDCIPNRVDHKFKAHDKEATCLAFNYSGSLLATGGADACIKIWDISRGCECNPIKSFTRPISCIAFAKDNETLMMACSIDR